MVVRLTLLGDFDERNASSTLIQNRAGAWMSPYSLRNASQPFAGVELPGPADGDAWANFSMTVSGEKGLQHSPSHALRVLLRALRVQCALCTCVLGLVAMHSASLILEQM